MTSYCSRFTSSIKAHCPGLAWVKASWDQASPETQALISKALVVASAGIAHFAKIPAVLYLTAGVLIADTAAKEIKKRYFPEEIKPTNEQEIQWVNEDIQALKTNLAKAEQQLALLSPPPKLTEQQKVAQLKRKAAEAKNTAEQTAAAYKAALGDYRRKLEEAFRDVAPTVEQSDAPQAHKSSQCAQVLSGIRNAKSSSSRQAIFQADSDFDDEQIFGRPD